MAVKFLICIPRGPLGPLVCPYRVNVAVLIVINYGQYSITGTSLPQLQALSGRQPN